jgi:hypothetical protein
MDGKKVKPIQKRQQLSAFERRMKNSNKIYGYDVGQNERRGEWGCYIE